jgi:NitT/TauT family transport system substrate-binding protein
VTSEPILAKGEGGDPQTFLISDAGYNPYTTIVIARGETVRQNPGMVKEMIAACREGWRSYLNDPKPANDVMGKLNSDMDAATFAAAAEAQKPLIETGQNPLGTMTAQRWEQLANQLVELKVISSAPPATDCFVDPKSLP